MKRLICRFTFLCPYHKKITDKGKAPWDGLPLEERSGGNAWLVSTYEAIRQHDPRAVW